MIRAYLLVLFLQTGQGTEQPANGGTFDTREECDAAGWTAMDPAKVAYFRCVESGWLQQLDDSI